LNIFDKIMAILTGGLWLALRKLFKLNPKYWFKKLTVRTEQFSERSPLDCHYNKKLGGKTKK